jgi:hypothetical protein
MRVKHKGQQPAAQLPTGYAELLENPKVSIHQAQVCETLSVNQGLIFLYWHFHKEILQRQQRAGWGIMEGFSPRILKYMRVFSEAWPDEQIVQPLD